MGSSSDSPLAQRYRFGIYEADPRSGELTRDGVKVKLQEQPFQVLLLMLERPGEIVAREELQQRLWPADTFVDFDHSLNTAINKLREALRDSAANPRFIETKAKRGYRFIAPVQVVGEAAVPPAAPQTGMSALHEAAPAQTGMSVLHEPASAQTGMSGPHELPKVHRGWARFLFGAIQVMYLFFYVIALVRLSDVSFVAARFLDGQGWMLVAAVIVTACVGIPIRFYLLAAVSFDYRRTGEKFLRIFPAVMVLDLIWALAPFLSIDTIGIGLAFAAMAGLLYLPFSQRTLIRMTYMQSS